MRLLELLRGHGYFTYGYHATNRERATEIMHQHQFRMGGDESQGDWLGRGVYFWQDAPNWAWEWLDRYWPRTKLQPQVKGKAVIRARIDLDRCLDLLDTRWNKIVVDAHEDLRSILGDKMPKQNWDPEHPRWNELDYAVINYATGEIAVRLQYAFRSVRAAFIEGTPFYQGSALYTHAHVAIAVIDHDAIGLGDLRIARSS
jgi:hypothetical protein